MNEQAIIGCLLTEPITILKCDRINEQMFEDSRCRYIFKAISELKRNDMSIDIITVKNQLDMMGANIEYTHITELSRKQISAANIDNYIDTLVYSYAKRALKVNNGLQNQRLQDDFSPIEEIEFSMKELNSILDILSKTGRQEQTITSLLVDRLRSYFSRKTKKELEYVTGIYDYDKVITYERGDLAILAARPGMGKTSFALQLARIFAQRMKVLFISLEMTAGKLTDRIIIAESGIDNERYKRGNLHQNEETQLNEISKQIENLQIVIDDRSSLSMNEIEILVMKQAPDIVFIDYLGLVRLPQKDSRNNELGYVSRTLKGLAKKSNIPIIALHQLNRGAETRADKRPFLAELRDSGEIEQDADSVVFLYSDEYYERKDRSRIEVIVAKNREGKSNVFIELEHDYQLSNFKSKTSWF